MAVSEQERFLKAILLKMRNPLKSPLIFKRPLISGKKILPPVGSKIRRADALELAIIWIAGIFLIISWYCCPRSGLRRSGSYSPVLSGQEWFCIPEHLPLQR